VRCYIRPSHPLCAQAAGAAQAQVPQPLHGAHAGFLLAAGCELRCAQEHLLRKVCHGQRSVQMKFAPLGQAVPVYSALAAGVFGGWCAPTVQQQRWAIVAGKAVFTGERDAQVLRQCQGRGGMDLCTHDIGPWQVGCVQHHAAGAANGLEIMPLARGYHAPLARDNAPAMALHFQFQRTLYAQQNLEMIVRMAPRRGAVLAH